MPSCYFSLRTNWTSQSSSWCFCRLATSCFPYNVLSTMSECFLHLKCEKVGPSFAQVMIENSDRVLLKRVEAILNSSRCSLSEESSILCFYLNLASYRLLFWLLEPMSTSMDATIILRLAFATKFSILIIGI